MSYAKRQLKLPRCCCKSWQHRTLESEERLGHGELAASPVYSSPYARELTHPTRMSPGMLGRRQPSSSTCTPRIRCSIHSAPLNFASFNSPPVTGYYWRDKTGCSERAWLGRERRARACLGTARPRQQPAPDALDPARTHRAGTPERRARLATTTAPDRYAKALTVGTRASLLYCMFASLHAYAYAQSRMLTEWN
jgi:hypothetical protein